MATRNEISKIISQALARDNVQMVVIVADHDVVDHATQKFGVVRTDDAGMAMLVHGLCKVGIGLGSRRDASHGEKKYPSLRVF